MGKHKPKPTTPSGILVQLLMHTNACAGHHHADTHTQGTTTQTMPT